MAAVTFSTGTFTNPRTQSLYFQKHVPTCGAVRGLVVFLHGLGEYSARYNELLEHVASHQWAVYSFDYIGHGRSDGETLYFDRFEDLIVDTEAFIAFAKDDVKSQVSSDKCVLIGNSIGGLLTNFVIVRKNQRVDAAILVAPGLDVPRTWALSIQSAFAAILSALVPKWRIVPSRDRNDLTPDASILAAMDDDPYLNKLLMPCRVGQEILDAFTAFGPRKADVEIPMLVLFGSDEKMVCTASIRRYVDEIASKKKELREFSGMGHLMLLESNRSEIFEVVTAWLKSC
ncbi:Aste57867_13373 [Aphanomyces stellatus]|uniref:Aste57867_13373 protein n=1 Tax=Aphanomyces stellatus TaxID=120398 RepID=A0A485KY72_9STRA|nr:hypothetical protein As57867_013323 [Aphanomyces stellatus]VFT90212.1 Aste57867_13373 [Aphanomyces stellatus]